MFSGSIRAGPLAAALAAPGVLVDDCNVVFDPDGLRIAVMEPSTIGAVDLRLDAAAFESYETEGEVVGTSVTRLREVVGLADPDRPVHLEADADARDLRVRTDGLAYRASLIDPDVLRNRPTLGMELPASVALEGRELRRIVGAADLVASHFEMGVDAAAGTFFVRAGDETCDLAVERTRDELLDLRAVDAVSTYSVDYFREYSRVIPADATVRIEFGRELPSKTHYGFADGDGEGTYFLAPRLQ